MEKLLGFPRIFLFLFCLKYDCFKKTKLGKFEKETMGNTYLSLKGLINKLIGSEYKLTDSKMTMLNTK